MFQHTRKHTHTHTPPLTRYPRCFAPPVVVGGGGGCRKEHPRPTSPPLHSTRFCTSVPCLAPLSGWPEIDLFCRLSGTGVIPLLESGVLSPVTILGARRAAILRGGKWCSGREREDQQRCPAV
eukprot:TRINITY_DN1239_c1_g1_i1.p2 TRINITY_DN1239_c1_g1~~TRINITY_DN1239_c1_g1_i1.p2  ORF type:complete len:123 (+),score=7.54 TRINITY_DN1239_c1_g1_i1:24-392(+)